MFGIPLPWLLVGLFITLFGTYRGGYHFGWTDRDKEMQIEIARKNEESRQTELKLTEQINTTATKLQETTNVVNQKQTDLNRLIAAGRVRIPTASCVQATPNPTIAARDSNQAPSKPDRAPDPDPGSSGASEAERQTLQLIAQIAADGDRAINQLNACIDAYDNMRNIINAQR